MPDVHGRPLTMIINIFLTWGGRCVLTQGYQGDEFFDRVAENLTGLLSRKAFTPSEASLPEASSFSALESRI